MYLKYRNLTKIKDKVSNAIIDWSNGTEGILNIISPPYNMFPVFFNVIAKFIKNKKNVLYISNEDFNDTKIIKKNNFKKQYTYYRGNKLDNNNSVVFSSHNRAKNLNIKFDLVIYDDIKSFSNYTNEEIRDLTLKMCKDNGKIIVYSIEKIFKEYKEIVLPIRDNYIPLIEPKYIPTRININKDIPYLVYEYIEWSINSNRKVIIYVPNESKVVNVYKYLSKYCNKNNGRTIPFIKYKSDNKIICNFKSMEKFIVVTNNINEKNIILNNINIMVFFADDTYFDYKKLVYICGKVGRNEKVHNGEVIFVGNHETESIDKAKNITRGFNKKAWDMSLLKS